MKRFFASLGKAVVYFLVYFLSQLIFSFGAAFVLSFAEIMKSGTAEVDPAVLAERVTARLLELTTLITVLSGLFAIGVVCVAFLIRKKRIAEELSFRRVPPKKALACVGGGFSCALILTFLVSLIPFPQSLVSSFEEMYATLDMGHPVINAVAVVIFAPLVEEIFFRGLIYTRLKKGMPTAVAAILSAAAFGAMHGEVIWMLTGFLAGLILVWVFEKTGSLWASIAVHLLNNALSLIDTSGKPWLDLVILVVALAVFGASLWYFVREKKRAAVLPSEEEREETL